MISAERYFSSLARMEADEAELKREKRQYEGQQQSAQARGGESGRGMGQAGFHDGAEAGRDSGNA